MRRNYTLKIFHGQKVERYRTKSLRRFLRHARTIKWEDKPTKVYLKVSYEKFPDHRGKLTTFFNDGIYTNEKDFNLALKAFLEE